MAQAFVLCGGVLSEGYEGYSLRVLTVKMVCELAEECLNGRCEHHELHEFNTNCTEEACMGFLGRDSNGMASGVRATCRAVD